jgi:hypothetical protein
LLSQFFSTGASTNEGKSAVKHLSEDVLRFIRSLMPTNSHFVLIVATAEGTGVDTDILDQAKAKAFVLETGNEMVGECGDTNGDGDCPRCIRGRGICPSKN